jgi:hypothetical protein
MASRHFPGFYAPPMIISFLIDIGRHSLATAKPAAAGVDGSTMVSLRDV